MVKSRTMVLFFLSASFAVGAAWVANNWINQQQGASLPEDDQQAVVAAALDIPYGQRIESRHLKMVKVPEDAAPGNSFQELALVEGKIATDHILAGDVIRAQRVSEHAEGATLAALIEPKMRAFTVRVNDVVGVAGFLLPGNRVDVIVTRKDGKRAVSETVLRDLKVLAVDQLARTDKNDPVVVRSVTLEVSPQEAEILAKGRDEGNLQLTLRNPLDDFEPPVAEVKPARKKVTRSYVAQPQVIIIKGTEWEKKKVPM